MDRAFGPGQPIVLAGSSFAHTLPPGADNVGPRTLQTRPPLPPHTGVKHMIEIWHNPRCSKSREALAFLEQSGRDVNVVLYLEAPPSPARIEEVLALLGGLPPRDLMRKKEAPYAELGLGDDRVTREGLVRALSANPVLLERPIVIANGRAIVARPERDGSAATPAELLAAFLG